MIDLEISLCVVGWPSLPPVRVGYSVAGGEPRIESLILGGGDILPALNERQREALTGYVRHVHRIDPLPPLVRLNQGRPMERSTPFQRTKKTRQGKTPVASKS